MPVTPYQTPAEKARILRDSLRAKEREHLGLISDALARRPFDLARLEALVVSINDLKDAIVTAEADGAAQLPLA